MPQTEDVCRRKPGGFVQNIHESHFWGMGGITGILIFFF